MKSRKTQIRINTIRRELEIDDTNPTKAIVLYKKVGFKVFRKLLVYLRRI